MVLDLTEHVRLGIHECSFHLWRLELVDVVVPRLPQCVMMMMPPWSKMYCPLKIDQTCLRISSNLRFLSIETAMERRLIMMGKGCYRNVKSQQASPPIWRMVVLYTFPSIDDGSAWDWSAMFGAWTRNVAPQILRVERLTASVARLCRVAMLPQDIHYLRRSHLTLDTRYRTNVRGSGRRGCYHWAELRIGKDKSDQSISLGPFTSLSTNAGLSQIWRR